MSRPRQNSGFTRLALTALAGMGNRVLLRSGARSRAVARRGGEAVRRQGGEAEEGDEAVAHVAPPAAPTAENASPSPPVDHFQRLKPRSGPPLVARIAGRSLPILGLVGALLTTFLAVGAVRGELPYVGSIDSANPAWAAALVTVSLWAAFLLWKVPQWQAAAWERSGNTNPRELFQIENESRATLGQILSGVAVLTGLIFAWQQLGQTSDNLRVSQEGQITERFTRAVDQLSSDNLTVQLGGIYALERIARDSPRDYGPVMEVLTTYARERSPASANAAATPAALGSKTPPDVVAIFKVIGRRTPEQVALEMEAGGCLDLSRVNAIGANLAGANLRNTCWNGADLREAFLKSAGLSDATFDGSNLGGADLDSATGTRASFAGATLAGIKPTNLSEADLEEANLLSANLTGAILQGTNLANASLLSTNLSRAQLLLGTNLSGANVLGATFACATLFDTNLATVKNLTSAQIVNAQILGATTLPEGVEIPPDSQQQWQQDCLGKASQEGS